MFKCKQTRHSRQHNRRRRRRRRRTKPGKKKLIPHLILKLPQALRQNQAILYIFAPKSGKIINWVDSLEFLCALTQIKISNFPKKVFQRFFSLLRLSVQEQACFSFLITKMYLFVRGVMKQNVNLALYLIGVINKTVFYQRILIMYEIIK